MLTTEHSKQSRANRCYEGWSDQLSREAAARKWLRRTLFGKARVRRTRERCWQPVRPSRKTQFRYDTLNRVTIERVLGGGITRIVDAAGRVVTVTSTGGRITQLQDPLGRTVSYAYGANGRLATVTDPEKGCGVRSCNHTFVKEWGQAR